MEMSSGSNPLISLPQIQYHMTPWHVQESEHRIPCLECLGGDSEMTQIKRAYHHATSL